MSLVMTCLLCVVLLLTAEGGGGMPPFVLLNTLNTFKAGETTTLKLILFGEQRGNVTVKYYSTYGYPTVKTLVKESTTNITEKMTAIELPIEVPTHKHDVLKSSVISLDGYFEDFGWFDLGQKSLHSSRVSGYKTYVQTDKPIYKPGQTVRFRGFSVDSSLIGMMLTDGLGVAIQNPDGIEIFEDIIRNDEGVIHQGDFVLADEAKLGTYRIVVTGESHASCSFDVEEYVLPKFGVEIMGPRNIQPEDYVIKGSVSATYTYGKPVNGKVTLKFGVDNKSQRSYFGPYFFQETTTALVEGKADWEVDMKEITEKKLKYLFNPWCTPSVLVVAATVSSEDGGFVVEEVDSSTKFSQTTAKLTFSPNTQKHYAAGFPLYVELDVAVQSLTADELKNVPVKITMISGLSDLKYEVKEAFVSEGKVSATFEVPEGACAVKITAEMAADSCESVFACFQPERVVSKSDDFIRFYKTEQQSLEGGDTMTYKLLSTKRLQFLHFVILSQGNIVKSWKTEPQWTKHMSGKFLVRDSVDIPQDIITRSRLVAISANSGNGYILADAIDICIKEKLSHDLNLKFSESIAKPGQQITITLNSDPASFVGLSVTDTSLSLLSEPCKVLSKESTLSFLRDLDEGTTKDRTCKREDPFQCKSNTEVKIIDVKELLKNEGLDLDTNMNIFEYTSPRNTDFGRNFHHEKYEYFSYSAATDMMDPQSMATDDAEIILEEPESDVESLTRNFFPESWIWTDTVSDKNGNTVLSLEAPDTITGWKGTAFGLSPSNGLGFSNEVEMQTFLPFFISLDLPYSGTVGERITIPVRIFNYKDEAITAEVKVSSKLWADKTEVLVVLPNKAKTLRYTITLTEAGNHEILVSASSNMGDVDAVEKRLFVQPGGEKIVETESILIMNNEKDLEAEKVYMMVNLPENFIPGSHSLKLVAVGDILGEAASGISNIIQLPSGCGEQNMHKVAINVFAANYLRSLYQELPENIDYNLKHGLNVGLQQQLAYRTGSTWYSSGYSVFKNQPSSHWLTTFVYRILNQYPADVFVPCDTIQRDFNYIIGWMKHATDAGVTSVDRKGWAPTQYVYHENRNLYWMSYYLIAILESHATGRCTNQQLDDKNLDMIGKVCNATLDMALISDDCCYHHMVAYSIELCKQNGFLDHVEDFYENLSNDDYCISSSRNGQYAFAACGENLEYESVKASSRAVEATGYAALLRMLTGDPEDVLPMIMWLASQRNENGGFRSSQDTVIGLQALSSFAALVNAEITDKTDLVILIGKGNKYFERLRIRDQNKLTTKEVHLDNGPGKYKVRWTGFGTAFVQLISTYHMTGKDYEPIYQLQADVIGSQPVTIQVTFKLPKESNSTMFLLEMTAPTGMVFTKSLIEGQMRMTDNDFASITRYDIKEGGQRLQLYIDPQREKRDVELHVVLDSRFTVANRKPAQISLVDYYKPSSRQTVFYSIDDSDESNTDDDQEY